MKRNERIFLSFFGNLQSLSTVFFLTLLIFSSQAFGNVCFGLLEGRSNLAVPIDIDPRFENIISATDKRFKPALFQMVLMAGQARDPVVNAHEVEKKGHIVLAQPLAAGYSVEFTYKSDKRVKERFRLKEAVLVKPNGSTVKIVDEMTSESGEQLVVKTLSIKLSQQAPSELRNGNFKLQMPLKIEEALLTEFRKWTERFEFLDAESIRQAGVRENLRPLYWKYQWNFHVDLFLRRSRIYYMRALIFGTTVAATAALVNLPYTEIFKYMNPSPNHISALVRTENSVHSQLQKIISSQSEMFFQTAAHYNLVNHHSAIENTLQDGKVSIFGALEGSTSAEHFTAVVFKQSGKVILTRFSTTGEVRGVILSFDNTPTEYNSLMQLIERGIN